MTLSGRCRLSGECRQLSEVTGESLKSFKHVQIFFPISCYRGNCNSVGMNRKADVAL